MKHRKRKYIWVSLVLAGVLSVPGKTMVWAEEEGVCGDLSVGTLPDDGKNELEIFQKEPETLEDSVSDKEMIPENLISGMENETSESLSGNKDPESLSENKVPGNLSENKVPESLSGNKVPDSLSENKVPESLSGNKVPDSLSENKVSESLSENKVPESLSENKAPESLSENKVSENFSENKVSESLSENKVPESLSENKVPESLSENKVPESLSENKAPESLSENKAPENLSQNKADRIPGVSDNSLSANFVKQDGSTVSENKFADIVLPPEIPLNIIFWGEEKREAWIRSEQYCIENKGYDDVRISIEGIVSLGDNTEDYVVVGSTTEEVFVQGKKNVWMYLKWEDKGHGSAERPEILMGDVSNPGKGEIVLKAPKRNKEGDIIGENPDSKAYFSFFGDMKSDMVQGLESEELKINLNFLIDEAQDEEQNTEIPKTEYASVSSSNKESELSEKEITRKNK